MKDFVLELINSYENRIATVEEWVVSIEPTTAGSNGSFDASSEEREKLKTSLQKILAKNCSLRKKDFSRLMVGILNDSERKKRGIAEERRGVIQETRGYLNEQKELAISLRGQLTASGLDNRDELNTAMNNIRLKYRDAGQQLFARLRSFQSHLSAFQREQEEINHELQRLVDRGESLRLEDLRQLEKAKAGQERKVGRELRRQEVARLLAHFKGQRQEVAARGGSENPRKEEQHGNRVKHEGTGSKHCFFPSG